MSEKSNLKQKPPHRIETERTIIRRYDLSDATMLLSTISKSLEHLRPWMDWAAHEPESLEAKTNRLKKNHDNFDSGVDFTYGIFNKAETELLGATGLHPRIGPNAVEIGYWVSATQTNQGIATEVSAALTRVAFEISGVEKVEIRCDPTNIRSSRIPQKLGFVHSTTLLGNMANAHGQPRDTMVWSMLEEDYRESYSSDARISAFDAAGNAMPLWS